MNALPTLLFHCHHSLGMGHLVRSLHLVDALRQHFHIVLLSGGRVPADIVVPAGVDLVQLPALALEGNARLHGADPRCDVDQARTARRERILAAFNQFRPAVVMIELFPFGRKKLRDELLPLLDAARKASWRPLVLCSLRDILVHARKDQALHDERAVRTVNTWFDAILLHADAAFARLEDSCSAAAHLTRPIHYTGFVTGTSSGVEPTARRPYILVSAGGGIVGKALLETALAAHRLTYQRTGTGLRLVTGPFYPETDLAQLLASAQGMPAVEIVRSLPSLVGDMRTAAASISQCGYNTAMELLRTGVPALVVPYAEGLENEQTVRAERLAALGLIRVLPASRLTPEVLAGEMARLPSFVPSPRTLALDGAQESARVTRELHERNVAAGVPA